MVAFGFLERKQIVQKLSSYVQKIQLALGTLFISIFFLTIVVQVFCRYAGITVMWTGEVSTYSFTWAVFLGAGAMTYENKHFSFDSLVNKLEGKSQALLKILISIIVLIFSMSIFYYGMQITTKFWNYRWITLSEIKMGYTWLCVPILGATSTLYGLTHILEYIQEIKNGGNQS